MKKITVILIVVFCFLSLIELFCVANERPNYKKIWDSWTEFEKCAYLWGLRDGLYEQPTASGYSLLTHPEFFSDSSHFHFSLARYYLSKYPKDTQKAIEEERSKAYKFIIEFCSPKIPTEAIRDVTTDLYKDPANSYIRPADMCFIAFWKLKGKDVESVLIELRERASKYYY